MATSLDPGKQQDATHHKTLAELKFKDSNFKSALKHAKKAHRISPDMEGLSSMLTAFRILYVASKAAPGTAPDWYKILQVEPFSHINTIKKQYKKLALVLHPDKNPHVGCEDAFKFVGEGFGVFSDRIRRKEYDMMLRIRMQEERVNGAETTLLETFWTACSRCRLLHQFEKKYLGHNLVCPSCKKSFQAVEVESGNDGDENEKGSEPRERSKRSKRKVGGSEWFWNVSLGSKVVRGGLEGEENGVGGSCCEDKNKESGKELGGPGGQWGGGRLRSGGLRRRMSTVGEVLARSEEKRVEVEDVSERLKSTAETRDETMTLAEMQMEMKQKANKEKSKLKRKEKETGEGEKEERYRQEISESRDSIIDEEDTLKNGTSEVERQKVPKKSRNAAIKTREALKKIVGPEIETRGALKSSRNSKVIKRRASGKKRGSEILNSHNSGDGNFDIIVKDSEFYDFDKDRVERSFNKGQVWAVYDDNDGMPRHYCLIDEIVSLNPFEVKICWLDLQNHGDEALIYLEKMGFHVSCGRFKVAKKASLNYLNIFSHVMACERAAREVYRIYPKKGSVWALYNEAALGAGGRTLSDSEKRRYGIVVCLTSYSDVHGLSVAYLEKVDGFRTVFKRLEVGSHAITWFQKDDIRLLSHHISSKKLSGDEVPELLKDCWELDPVSLPSDLLTIGLER